MLKRLGVPLLALAALFSVNPKPADARVHVGVYLGAPAYAAPVPDPYYYSPYAYDPYYEPYYEPYYSYPPAYSYGPSYEYPSYRGHYGRRYERGHERNE